MRSSRGPIQRHNSGMFGQSILRAERLERLLGQPPPAPVTKELSIGAREAKHNLELAREAYRKQFETSVYSL